MYRHKIATTAQTAMAHALVVGTMIFIILVVVGLGRPTTSVMPPTHCEAGGCPGN